MNKSNVRYYSLDYLRGLMALSVMIYHYSMWLEIPLSNSNIISKLGVYAVIVFYILSGLSLSLVYGKSKDFNYRGFYIKRFFRIFPLYFAVVTVTISLQFANFLFSAAKFNFDPVEFLLNTTLLFGVFSPSSYIPIGGWSIGNEIFFYLLFPAFVFAFKNINFLYKFFIVFLSFLCFVIINFFITLGAENAWSLYILPYNHVLVFVFGFIVGLARPSVSIRIPCFIIFLLSVFIFCIYTPESSKFSMLFGWDRLILTLLICIITLVYFLMNFNLSGFFHSSFNWIGEHCYSIYLIHPLVFFPVKLIFEILGLPSYGIFFLSIFLTICTSYFSYRYIELPGMNFGKSLSRKINL